MSRRSERLSLVSDRISRRSARNSLRSQRLMFPWPCVGVAVIANTALNNRPPVKNTFLIFQSPPLLVLCKLPRRSIDPTPFRFAECRGEKTLHPERTNRAPQSRAQFCFGNPLLLG